MASVEPRVDLEVDDMDVEELHLQAVVDNVTEAVNFVEDDIPAKFTLPVVVHNH